MSDFPALATVEQFQARLGRTLSGDDLTRAQAALDDVSAEARDVMSRAYVEDPSADPVVLSSVPATVVAVVCSAARRVFENPGGLQQETLGAYSYSRQADPSADAYLLSNAERRTLRRAAGRTGLGVVDLVRGRNTDTNFVEVAYGNNVPTPGGDDSWPVPDPFQYP